MNDLALPMCSPAYLERLQMHDDDPVEQLREARLIDSVKTIYRWDFWLSSNRIEVPDIAYPFRFDRSSMSIEMAKEGGGVALDSAVLCLRELERGELVPFAPSCPVIDFPAYWIVCPPRHLNRRIVNRFARWVTDEAQDYEARTRQVLEKLGCDFRPSSGPEMIEVEPTVL